MSDDPLHPVRWFTDHFDVAADEVIDFLGGDGISLEGRRVADVGCGDGILDLGLALKGNPVELVGYDLRPVDASALLRSAQAAETAEALPDNLRFEVSQPTLIPAQDETFDVVVSWSVFEHVDDPVGLLREVRRVMRPNAYFFLQVWPFYLSEHGGHLWPHYHEPFPHLLKPDEEILAHVEGRPATAPRRGADDEYRSLNRITLDGLQRALLSSGFVVSKLKLLVNPVHIPVALNHLPLSDLGVGGVELLAAPV